MKRIGVMVLLVAAAAGCSHSRTQATWKLVRVIDGDTLIAESTCCQAWERVRLLCIDAPERGEPGFAESREHLARLIAGESFRLEHDPAHDQRDRWGRRLAYLLIDTRNINAEMIAAGHARLYLDYGGPSSSYSKAMLANSH